MESSIVKLSEFAVGGLHLARLDAEFVSPSLLSWEREVVSLPGSKLGAATAEYDGAVVNDKFKDADLLVDYVAIDNVDTSDGLIIPSKIRFEDRPSRAKFVVKSGDILVSNVRPNRGGVALATKRVAGSLASSGFTLIRPRSEFKDVFSGEFLFAFLRSEFGRDQLVRRNRGSMYPAVIKDDVCDVWIPKPSPQLDKEVKQLVTSGLKLHDRFFEVNAKQQTILHTYLKTTIGAPPPSPLSRESKADRNSIRSSSDFFGSKSAQRFDAEFFRPEYEEFDDRVSGLGNCFLIGDHYDCFAGRSQGKHLSEISYLRQSVLTNYGINWSAAEVEMGDPDPPSARVKCGDILMACTAHEIYYVARKNDYVRSIPEDIQDVNVCVADIMILRPKTKKALGAMGTYVSAFLRSDWGLHQVQRCIRGLRGGHVYGFDVESYVRVPMPDAKWLRDFERISAEAEDCRNKGRESIEGAVKVVEAWARKLPSSALASAA